MKVKINESNKWAIHDFSLLNDRARIQGSKLQALYKLIQSKGKIINASDNEYLDGVKVLEYEKNIFIGLVRTGFNSKSFFPCKMKIINLKSL